MQETPSNYYYKNILKYKAQLIKKQRVHQQFSIFRITFFVLIIVTSYYFRTLPIFIGILGLIGSILLFFWSIKRSLLLNKEITKLKELIRINENETEALGGNFEMFHSGSEYIDKSHPYTYDLDVFGPASLFCYLNRTCTIAGKNRLAEHLSSINVNIEEIKERQEAVSELKFDPDWCQNFISEALSVYDFSTEVNEKKDQTKERLSEWSSIPFFVKHKRFIRVMTIVLPVFVLGSLSASIAGILPYRITGLFVLVNLAFVGIYLKKINREHERFGRIVKSLKKIEILINLIESKAFKSSYLNRVKSRLGADKQSGRLIKTLYKTLQAFDQRLNMLTGVLLNGFILWDLQILIRLEKQKQDLHLFVPKWFDVLGEFDSMISLSVFAFNHPEYVVPSLSDEAFYLSYQNGGHPLLHKEKRVNNDFEISGLHKIVIITGANMAGKSTFLRTVNVNMILGASGAPVCATFFKFSPVPLYTSIRTDDSLSKSESYFFAELMRLKKITDELKSGKTLFITLDEMLKGTNSKDKHQGSYALIEQLIRYNASGLAATHDIELGKLAEVYSEHVSNKRFEVEIIGDELHFDYQLKEGISQNLNASFLMKKYGITE